MSDPSLPPSFVIRPLEAGEALSELNWVRKAWKRGARREFDHVPTPTYHVGMTKLIGHLGLSQRILVMALPTGTPGRDEILGFICYRQMHVGDPAIVVHYLAVKPEVRKCGAAARLLEAAGWQPGMPIVGSFRCRLPAEVRQKWAVTHNPFFIMLGSG